MVGFKRIEDRPTPPEVYNWRIYMVAVLISWGSVLFGYDGSFLGTTITQPSFTRAFGLDNMTKSEKANTSSNITSTFQAAAFFGCVAAWGLMERFGRRFTIQASSALFILGALLQTIATDQLSLIYVGRAFTGFAVGGITSSIPTFIAEISPPAIRGELTGFFEIAYQIGSVIGFWINYFINISINTNTSKAWRIPMAFQLVPAGLLAIGSVFFPETPHFRIKRGEESRALKTLSYLRQLPEDHQYIQEEIAMIKAQIEREKAVAPTNKPGIRGYIQGSLKEFSLPGIRNRLALVFIMFMFQNFSGANAINYYSPTLFKSIGVSNVPLYTGIYGLVKAIGSIIFYIWFIDIWGRRPPWLTSSILCSLCMFYVGAYVKIGHPADQTTISPSTKHGGTAATTLIMFYSLFWSFGANGLPWIIGSEIFPLRIRSICSAYTAMCQWLWQFVITRTTPNIFNAMSWGTFIFFGGCLLASALWAFFFFPETRGLDLTQMDYLFGFYPHEESKNSHRQSAKTRANQIFIDRNSQKPYDVEDFK